MGVVTSGGAPRPREPAPARLHESDLELRAFRIPMRTRFRGVTERTGVLVRGGAGWGEFSPFPEYESQTTKHWRAAALEAALESWPAPLRTEIPVNVTIPAVAPELAHGLTAVSGCRTAKVKVGDPGDEDRVAAVRDALGPTGLIRVDANGAWDVDTAIRRIRALDRYSLEYVEQPAATAEELALVRRRVDVPIAADESIRNESDPLRVKELEAADIIVLKVQPLGGVRRALEVAEAVGLPAVVSSAVETSIGIAAGLALAAALPRLDHACGLATASMLEGDVVAAPLVPINGIITLRRPLVDEAALARFELGGRAAALILERFHAAGAAP